MQSLIDAMAATRLEPWDTIVVIGTSGAVRLPFLRRLGARRLVLIEPQPEQYERLAKVIDASLGESIDNRAVTASESVEVSLHLCNDPSYAAFAPPRRLMEIFPNLQVTGTITVPARPLRVLVNELGVERLRGNLLLVDAPGQLELLSDVTGLPAFSDIVIKAGVDPLFDGDASLAELRERLSDAGFERLSCDPRAVAPFQTEAYRFNESRFESAAQISRAVLAIQGLEQEIVSLKQEREILKAAHQGLAQQNSTLVAALESAREERNEAVLRAEHLDVSNQGFQRALDEANALLEREKQGLAEASRHLQRVTTEGRDAQRQADQLREIVGAHEEAIAALEQQKGEISRTLQSVSAERDGAIRKCEEQQKQLEHLKQRLNEFEGRLQATHDAMALAVRMQTLRESDLDEIQQRYSELHEAHESQRILLAKLSSRLVAANEYFQKLARDKLPTLEGGGQVKGAVGDGDR